MKFFVMYVMNTMAVYGRTARQVCRPIVLLFYTYDGNGMRYQKIVNGVETEYYYNGTQLLVENRNGNRMYYIYGVTGIEGFEYGTGSYPETYYFDKNTLGDVVAIRDESGNILAKYEYDAWGNVTVYDQYGNEKTDATFIGNINPIRYRGYYYDVETGFYYLQTRYYDPTICRFINADNYELVAQLSIIPGQLNMYAYANNNPIMYTDETGEGVVFQFIVSLFSYTGMLIASIWDEDIRADMNAISWNPFNSDESAVLNSSKVSFYKGVPVFRHSIPNATSASIFGMIFLNRNETRIDTVKHEWGHSVQAMVMGTPNYLMFVAIPSLITNLSSRSNRTVYDNYYSYPWERSADWLGGANNGPYRKHSLGISILYLFLFRGI